ncbi:hypothetical protein ACOMHN_024342 [Nucella lapillus]
MRFLPKNKQDSDQRGALSSKYSTSEILIEKHLQHQRDLFHNFIDIKISVEYGTMRMAAQQEIRTRLSLASSAMTKLDTIWKTNTVSLPVKIRLYTSLVIFILLYGCESWTLNAETGRWLQTFEHKRSEQD